MNIDVVIPVFNGQNYIARALDSVLDQTYKPNRIIVIDDGSSDSTIEIIKKYQLKIENLEVFTEQHKGLSATRNKGIEISTAKYIAFLDCDDYWSPDKLHNQAKHLLEHINCKAVFSNCFINNEIKGNIYKAPVNASVPNNFLNILTQRYRILGSASSICVDREVLNESGGFDENRAYGEDYDLWLKISRNHSICEIENRDVFITKRKNSMQTSKIGDMALFKNSIMYIDIWSEYPEFLRSERYTFESLIFPDIARSLISTPRNLREFFDHFRLEYQSVHDFLFPKPWSIAVFITRHSLRTLGTFLIRD